MIAEAPPRALSEVSLRELRDMLRALDAGWLHIPITELGLQHVGMASERSTTVARLLDGLDRPACRVVLEVAIAEREHRPPPRLDLVWTGPEARGTTARDTRVLVQELFERARVSVLVAGFRFDHGETLFKPLHERMQRGLTSTFFVDIEGEGKPAYDGRAYAERAIDRFVALNWPFGPPFPAIYYDPQSSVAGPPWVSLHAKCIVIDDVLSLVTSANFTDRGQRRNIEVGVCIEDNTFAERLASQWHTLIARGLVARWGAE